MNEAAPTVPTPESAPSVVPGFNGDAGARAKKVALRYGFWTLIAAGIVLRVFVVAFAGDQAHTPWGGTGDAPAYILLAHNLADGRGYAYGGYPTAYRAPVYPLLLAGSIKLFGENALVAMRWLQLFEGLGVALLCASTAGRIWGGPAKSISLVIALFFPTLVMMTGEILTETLATLFSAVFIYLLVRYLERPRWDFLLALAVVTGLATLVRFNMAIFGIVLLAATIFQKSALPRWRNAAIVVLVPTIIVSPWLIRNHAVFNGAWLLSTESGPTAVMGVLAPQGRALPGDSERLYKALGWVPPVDIETNAASRSQLPAESVLNQRAWKVTFGLWRSMGRRLIPLEVKKLSWFWFSTDQLLFTESFSRGARLVRAAGVFVYWLLLALGLAGWLILRGQKRHLARLLVLYAALVTLAHLPFNMNTRLRIPFIDPVVAVLAGAGWGAIVSRVSPGDESNGLNLAPG